MDAKQIYENAQENSITENQQLMFNWVKYRDELKTIQQLVKTLPEKMSHEVMVPLGSKAMIPGKIVHTNEFLVNLGSNYHVTKTSKQTSEYCDRRINDCDEMLTKLEYEIKFIQNKLQVANMNDAFGSNERPEIIEHVTEEEDANWRENHKKSLKEYHQRIGQLRQEEHKKIENEQDLWDRLDQLEMEEELEDELNRLQENDEEYEENRPKSVVFKDSIEVDILDPVVLNFKHSNNTVIGNNVETTPGDIYPNYLSKTGQVSILKVKKNPNEILERAAAEKVQKNPNFVKKSEYHIKDVIENPSVESKPEAKPKKISKFKQSRMK